MARKRDRDEPAAKTKSSSDVYTGMLVISLLATIVGLTFVFLDYNQYPPGKPPNPKQLMPTPGAGAAAQ
jgi:hypothetical protein